MPKPVSIEDNLAIQDLLGRYCWYVDENKADEWAALYTEDGIFEGAGPQAAQGTEALKHIPAGVYAGGQGKMRHQYGNLWMEYGADENTLVANFYNQIITWGGGGKLNALAVCTATLVRTPGGWRIKKNSLKFIN
jgi:hypothetical protein